MSMTQLLRILYARRRVLLWVLVTIFGLDLAITLILPKKYTAVATVIADPRAPDPVYGYMVPTYGGAETNTATQVDIITSDRVGLRVVQLLGLDKDESARQAWKIDGEGKGTLEQFISGSLSHGLDVKPSRDSDVINVSFTAPDPAFAAAAANAYARAYVEVSLELRTDPARASSVFFDARTKQLRADVENAQNRLSEFQRNHGIAVTDERLDIENARLNELSTQLTAVEAQRAESQSRQNQALGSAANSPDVMQNPVILQLRTDISRAEAKVQELRKQFGANHPQLQAAQAELDSLNAKMQAEMRQAVGSVGAVNAVNQQREAELRTALEDQKKRVLVMRAERDQAVVLQKDLEAAQKAYDLVAQRRSQTNLESLNQQANVAVLSESLPPLDPSRPRVKLNLLVGAFLGTLLGIAAALGLEMRDRRVRGQEDIAQVFSMPVLVALPFGHKADGARPGEGRSLGARLQRLRLRRRASALPAAGTP